MSLRTLLLFATLCAACSRPVGWFRADKSPTADDAYDERFEPLALQADGGCEPVLARQGEAPKPIIVLVPGVGGDGEEMHEAVPLLMATKPAAMFMFRYTPFENLGALAERLAEGLTQLTQYIPDKTGRLLVLSHSAGGVVSSYAVSQVRPPAKYEGTWLTLLTVASPLAGTSGVVFSSAPATDQRLMRVMGTRNTTFPPSAAGVRVIHLRTSAQSDGFMKPSGEHIPNDPSIGVPGAPQIDLPVELDHPKSLVYVAKRIGDGTWTEWLTAPAAP